MRRRHFAFGLGILLGTASVLGGCGGPSKSNDSKNAGEVYVYNWGEYIDEEVISMFEAETGI